MKKAMLLASFLLLLGACGGDEQMAQQVIQYQIAPNQYAVVIVQQGGMSQDALKDLAMKKAAQITVDKNFRYFTVESEGQVMAMSPSGSNSQAPSNLYYDLIQSGDYSRDQFSGSMENQTKNQAGFRIVFKCYQTSPGTGAVDACSVVGCKN